MIFRLSLNSFHHLFHHRLAAAVPLLLSRRRGITCGVPYIEIDGKYDIEEIVCEAEKILGLDDQA